MSGKCFKLPPSVYSSNDTWNISHNTYPIGQHHCVVGASFLIHVYIGGIAASALDGIMPMTTVGQKTERTPSANRYKPIGIIANVTNNCSINTVKAKIAPSFIQYFIRTRKSGSSARPVTARFALISRRILPSFVSTEVPLLVSKLPHSGQFEPLDNP